MLHVQTIAPRLAFVYQFFGESENFGENQLVERFRSSKSYGMLETAASVGWKVKDAIVGFHGIGRLVRSQCAYNGIDVQHTSHSGDYSDLQ